MTTKEWLNRAYKLDKEIDLLLREQAAAYDRACGITAAAGPERVQTSKRNAAEDKFVSFAAYSKMIDERVDELYSIKKEVADAVSRIGNSRLRRLLFCRYISFMTWEQIADELELKNVRHIYRLHSRALKKAGEVIPIPNTSQS